MAGHGVWHGTGAGAHAGRWRQPPKRGPAAPARTLPGGRCCDPGLGEPAGGYRARRCRCRRGRLRSRQYLRPPPCPGGSEHDPSRPCHGRPRVGRSPGHDRIGGREPLSGAGRAGPLPGARGAPRLPRAAGAPKSAEADTARTDRRFGRPCILGDVLARSAQRGDLDPEETADQGSTAWQTRAAVTRMPGAAQARRSGVMLAGARPGSTWPWQHRSPPPRDGTAAPAPTASEGVHPAEGG
ncbi:hypothetical protein JYK04_07741 [Streptomyces nojiriensis]|nr:hypothetical protein JYK04_07741 [Streptomyces nojiriensis]